MGAYLSYDFNSFLLIFILNYNWFPSIDCVLILIDILVDHANVMWFAQLFFIDNLLLGYYHLKVYINSLLLQLARSTLIPFGYTSLIFRGAHQTIIIIHATANFHSLKIEMFSKTLLRFLFDRTHWRFLIDQPLHTILLVLSTSNHNICHEVSC